MKNMEEFDDIRPYHDEEVTPTIEKLLKDPEFKRVVLFMMPSIDWEEFENTMGSFDNTYDFQHTIVKNMVFYLLNQSAGKVDCSGFENISNDRACTFISNHRDIVLDASILCVLLSNNGYDTAEIAIGDNLLIQPWINDVVRLNKSFIVKRGITGRQMFEFSKHLSEYIHYTIAEKKQSIWIAQREGRAKNSDDRTQDSLLKMLSMGSDKKFLESIEEVNVTPLSLSYEYDPCDYLKAKELQQKRDNPEFKKSPQDDLNNMETGIFGFKGDIHFQIGRPVNRFLQKIDTSLDRAEIVSAVAALVDKEIYLNYRFYPVNYIAYDRLWGDTKTFRDKYSEKDIRDFDDYMQKKLDLIDLPNKDIPYLSEKLMEMYAFPVKNYLSVKE
ncbi:MAG: 1-acyl-sn-glycerol-3-phosphate acyltransferase [Dysgonamonadaceae bacterium]|jgi:hypothetical protein|nr:1-acyl-sn-glycerol-3-phosphate acyltransferase [Dysgonamonadaceae bacterium]